jgi:primosomal protein N' (replication factor Y)
MFYYTVALSGLALDPLTYQSETELAPLTQVVAPFRKKTAEGYIIDKVPEPAFACETIAEKTGRYLPETTLKTARFIAGYYFCRLGEALALFTPFTQGTAPAKTTIQTAITLSPKQQEALEFCTSHPVSLLFGDTGSGKTEIYMKAFENLINEGKTALFLMPEISLTPQIEKRLKEHFGKRIAIWHSKITKPAKQKILQGIEAGSIQIVAGARSCLFLPMPDLGVIVVDEEHDDSYKSSQRPRYHARDLAIVIGKEKKIPVILGSATPAITSYEKFPRFRLKGQYFEAQSPHS